MLVSSKMSARLILVALLAGLAAAGKHDVYRGYTVYGVVVDDHADLELLERLEAPLDLDVWRHGAPRLRDAHVMVAPPHQRAFETELRGHNVQYYVELSDIPRSLELFDEELAHYRSSRVAKEAVPFEDYPRYAEVDAYLERIAAENPDIVTLVNAGNSYENRTIKYLKISTTNFEDASKPIYFMDAMIHAREWLTTPVALYAIHRLVTELREADRDLLEGTDWIILPIVNPDGYEWTHTDERLWRRTRSYDPAVATECLGVDANRNFDVAFNSVGVSANPCSQTYPGTTAFSEVETQIVRDILLEHLSRTQLYLNIHSYGNWVLFGFGNETLPANGVAVHHVGATLGAAIDAVKLPEAPFYLVGNSAFLLYATSGSAQDYAQLIGVPFSYTLELPGFGGYLFEMPPSFIAQINEETWRGIAAQARLAKLHYTQRMGL